MRVDADRRTARRRRRARAATTARPRGHALRDHHAERLRLGARMNDDVERAQRRRQRRPTWPVKPTMPERPRAATTRLRAPPRPLAAGGLVDRAADDVGADRMAASRSRAIASRNTSWPFQRANVATRPMRTSPRSGGRPDSAARSSGGPSGAEDRGIDGVVDAPQRRARPEHASPRHAARCRSWRRSRRRGAPAGAAARAVSGRRLHVFVQVPDEPRPAPASPAPRRRAPSGRCVCTTVAFARAQHAAAATADNRAGRPPLAAP